MFYNASMLTRRIHSVAQHSQTLLDELEREVRVKITPRQTVFIVNLPASFVHTLARTRLSDIHCDFVGFDAFDMNGCADVTAPVVFFKMCSTREGFHERMRRARIDPKTSDIVGVLSTDDDEDVYQ